MGSWSQEQATRLAYEESLLLEHGFTHFNFHDRTVRGKTTVQGWHTTAAGNTYKLCIRPTKNFPNEIPYLYVTSPRPLYGYRGKSIQSYGAAHSMHVNQPNWNNYVNICHWKDSHWSAAYTLVSVLMKGMLWLEAFEVHRQTGKKIDDLSLTF